MSFNVEMNEKIQKIENELKKYIDELNCPAQLKEAMEYSLFTGGKRLRPVILLAVCEMLGGEDEAALPFAAALEMIHTYSLIHDDLPAMDDDDMRRGKPTNHKVFGEGIAILSGDALLNYAYEIMADFCLLHEEANMLEAMSKIARYAGASGMIGGQVMDIDLSNPTREQLAYIDANKTAKLFMAAFAAGALCAFRDEDTVAKMENIGRNFGLAFQLLDDITDNSPSLSVWGKENAEKALISLIWEVTANLKEIEGSDFLIDLVSYVAAKQ
ncbi:MAG: polyprenyl synthetase family protein [Defluviitaleaceae bacterium]|nr:polyprenyl synthetase family protein [Defluviitaleaceae bacterium]